jgi:hypothetical protein
MILQERLKNLAHCCGFSLRGMRGVKAQGGTVGSVLLGDDGVALRKTIHADFTDDSHLLTPCGVIFGDENRRMGVQIAVARFAKPA